MTVHTKWLLFVGISLAGLFSAVPTVSYSASAVRKNPISTPKPSIVLVHGAFADGSSWSRVIPILEKDGYPVIAVQNPLSSLSDDVATTKRALSTLKGPVVVVGHSYGGMVITDAAAGNENVKALVYVAAFAPDAGETVSALNAKYSPSALGTALAPDPGGFLYVNSTKFHDVFCADLTESEAMVMAATQKPISVSCFSVPAQNIAWKTIPSWYLVSQNDQAINPDLERYLAQRMHATTIEVKSSHVAFLSHPDTVAKLIEQAAVATAK